MLELPDLLSTDCFYLEACGRLQGTTEKEERLQRIARVRVAQGTGYLRLLTGGESPGHIHVDIALKRFFPKLNPEVNSTRAAVSQEISLHYGKTAEVLVFAQFVTLVEDIQPGSGVVFGGPNTVVSTINNATIEVCGAHLVLRNDPFVSTIDWQLYKDDTVFVDISARCEVVLSRSYLSEIVERLGAAYQTYIIGRSVNATS